MKDSEADIAIGVLNKLIDQELEAVRAATRDGNTPFVGYAQTRHNAFLYARDEIRKALAAAVDERPDSASVPERSRHSHLRQQWHRTIPGCRPAYRALRHLRQVVEDLRRLAVPDHLGRSASLDDLAVLAQHLEDRP